MDGWMSGWADGQSNKSTDRSIKTGREIYAIRHVIEGQVKLYNMYAFCSCLDTGKVRSQLYISKVSINNLTGQNANCSCWQRSGSPARTARFPRGLRTYLQALSSVRTGRDSVTFRVSQVLMATESELKTPAGWGDINKAPSKWHHQNRSVKQILCWCGRDWLQARWQVERI